MGIGFLEFGIETWSLGIRDWKMCECGYWMCGCGGLYRQHLPRETIHLNAAAQSEHIEMELSLKINLASCTYSGENGGRVFKKALVISSGSIL